MNIQSHIDPRTLARIASLLICFSLPMAAQSSTAQQDVHGAKKASTSPDTLVLVTSQSAQGATDSVSWAQLGADGTLLGASFSATSSVSALAITGTLAGANSEPAVVCAATVCSWTGLGFTAGDTVIWTSDAANGGNGPLTIAFGRSVAGAGAMIQADGPGQFTAQIQAYNGTTLLGTFPVTSDTNGDAVYIGIEDQTSANITSVTFSLTSCAGTCTDFALDTAYLNSGVTTPTTTTLSLSLAAVNVGSSGPVVMTATAAPTSGSGTPTGSVNFFVNGGTAVGSGTLSSGSTTFSYNPSTLAVGSYNVTATYSGDTQFTTSTSSTQTLSVQDFTIAANPTTITVTAGQAGTSTLTITPLGGFSQTPTYSCSGLPTLSNCTFTSTGANSETISISTTAPSYANSWKSPFGRGGNLVYALLLPGVLGLILPACRRRQTLRKGLPLLAVLAVFALWLPACGGGTHNPGTPKGSYPITVTASVSGSAGSLTHTSAITLTVQ